MSEAETTKKVKYTSRDLGDRLREYLSGGEWVLQFEVANGTGTGVARHADAVAMSIWPSRGYKIHGYEIKVSRTDWQRELKEPKKADAVGDFCDAWFLIAPPDIVNEVEVPETWGWLVPSGKSLRIKKQPVLGARKEVTRSFIAAMLRNNHAADEGRVRAAVEKERAIDREQYQKRLDDAVKSRTRAYEDLKAAVARFEDQSGLHIGSGYREDPRLGQKLAIVEAIGVEKWNGLPQMIATLERSARQLTDAYTAFIGALPKDG